MLARKTIYGHSIAGLRKEEENHKLLERRSDRIALLENQLAKVADQRSQLIAEREQFIASAADQNLLLLKRDMRIAKLETQLARVLSWCYGGVVLWMP